MTNDPMTNIRLAFSTCPNDTFMFDALVHGRIDTGGLSFELTLADIWQLNELVLAGAPDMVKISYNTYGQVKDRYTLLEAGSALGHNCGPLLIAAKPFSIEELVSQDLPVAIPGANTTANLLLSYFAPDIRNKREMLFHEIMPAVLSGEVAAGLIIHENRFTYQQFGLLCLQDLGEYWEKRTGMPIPLGAIVARKSLGQEKIALLNRLMHDSVAWAFAHPEDSLAFVRSHAQEMDEAVMKAHIDLYVNEYSLKLGTKGHEAVEKLLEISQLVS